MRMDGSKKRENKKGGPVFWLKMFFSSLLLILFSCFVLSRLLPAHEHVKQGRSLVRAVYPISASPRDESQDGLSVL
jgi:hypothetical protein